jgi:hypothetical protein
LNVPLFYPTERIGRFGLAMGLTPRLLYERFGLDLGERFHHDVLYRIETLMQVDRLVWESFRELGLGHEKPFPRAAIEPFGHRFVPALYGCAIRYAAGEEPAAVTRALDPDELSRLPAWTPESLLAREEVHEVLAQAETARKRWGEAREQAERRLGYNPHYQPLSSLQNLGSVINTAVSVFGTGALCLYLDDPPLLRRLYRNVTDLMLECLRLFPQADRRRLANVFVGNCTVAMISPSQYAECNLAFDRELAGFASSIGARFLVHQDSDATPHLDNYRALGPVHGLDVGQDTDFARAAALFPEASVNCILFPSWIASTPLEGIREELTRLMRIGRSFADFTFSIFEVDPALARGRIFEFYELFKECARI